MCVPTDISVRYVATYLINTLRSILQLEMPYIALPYFSPALLRTAFRTLHLNMSTTSVEHVLPGHDTLQ